jgi:hypothetical protein
MIFLLAMCSTLSDAQVIRRARTHRTTNQDLSVIINQNGEINVAASEALNSKHSSESVLQHDDTHRQNDGKQVDSAGQVLSGRRRLNMEFGGSSHSTDSQGELLRPEFVKDQVCDISSGVCQECTDQSTCFTGHSTGRLKLQVPAGTTRRIYAAEVWARCPTGSAQWQLEVFRDYEPGSGNGITNGVLKVWTKTQGQKTLQHTISSSPSSSYLQTYTILVPQDSIIRNEFTPTDSSKVAQAYLLLVLDNIDPYVDDCMGTQECLEKLGDNSANAFLFRNSNTKQRDCLEASTSSAQSAVSSYCPAWASCLEAIGRKASLLALLKAATASGTEATTTTAAPSTRRRRRNWSSSLVAQIAQQENEAKVAIDENCFNPAVDDLESVECQCLDSITEACGTDDTCILNKLCNAPYREHMCSSWAGSSCSSSLLGNASSDAEQAADSMIMMRSDVVKNINVKDGKMEQAHASALDSGLSDKCMER